MSFRRFFPVILILAAWVAPAVGAEQATLSGAQADFTAGQFRPCLQKIASLLNTPDAKSSVQTRYDLFMMRGECLIQLKESSLAIDAFNAAAKLGKSATDVAPSAIARANAMIIQRSPGFQFKPDGGGAPIDIVSPDSRKLAMKTLFDQILAKTKPQIDQAMKGTSLTPIQQLLPTLTQMLALEQASTGQTTQTMDLGQQIGDHARQLITSEVDLLSGKITELTNLANEPSYSDNGRRGSTYTRRGLTSIEQDEVKAAGEYLRKIVIVCQDGRKINQRLGGTGEAWATIIADASDAMQQAEITYERK
jgi:hypothetical protein